MYFRRACKATQCNATPWSGLAAEGLCGCDCWSVCWSESISELLPMRGHPAWRKLGRRCAAAPSMARPPWRMQAPRARWHGDMRARSSEAGGSCIYYQVTAAGPGPGAGARSDVVTRTVDDVSGEEAATGQLPRAHVGSGRAVADSGL
jgi:hypothetical protein